LAQAGRHRLERIKYWQQYDLGLPWRPKPKIKTALRFFESQSARRKPDSTDLAEYFFDQFIVLDDDSQICMPPEFVGD
jgi:hypothetical protein